MRELFQDYLNKNYAYEYLKLMLKCTRQLQPETIILGSSYCLHGMDLHQLQNEVCLAGASQDLRNDYRLLKHICTQMSHAPLRRVVLVCGYYVLYDQMCKSEMGRYLEQTVYDPLFQYAGGENNVLEAAAQQFLIRQGGYFHSLYTREDNCEECYKGLNWQLADQKERDRYAMHRADRHNHLYTHPESKTVNEQYLSDIMDMCRHENLELWVIIPPFTKEYISALQPAFQQEFVQNLERQPCAIQYIDFNTDLPKDYFGISDFFDMDHLNDEGAAKFTKLLLGEIRRI